MINPDMMTLEQRLALPWETSDRKILSASNHDIQGIANDKMCKGMLSFPDVDGEGWINIYTTLYLCTIIPYALVYLL